MTKFGRIFRIVRMLRLLRLARMKEVFEILTERINSEKLFIVIDVFKLIVVMCSFGHFGACVFYYIGNTEAQEDWVSFHGYDEKGKEFRYVMAFRWSISQFGGGMDEIYPITFNESLFAILVYLLAYWGGAAFLGILTSSMTQLYLLSSQQSQQLAVLRRYLCGHLISKKLGMRVQRNA